MTLLQSLITDFLVQSTSFLDLVRSLGKFLHPAWQLSMEFTASILHYQVPAGGKMNVRLSED